MGLWLCRLISEVATALAHLTLVELPGINQHTNFPVPHTREERGEERFCTNQKPLLLLLGAPHILFLI